MSEIKECLFYIDHNPPEYSGTWGGAIHKGACKVNSTDCKDTDGCFIKNLYNKLKIKQQECKELKEKQKELLHDCNSCKFHQYKQALNKIESRIQLENADDCLLDIMEIIKNIEEI